MTETSNFTEDEKDEIQSNISYSSKNSTTSSGKRRSRLRIVNPKPEETPIYKRGIGKDFRELLKTFDGFAYFDPFNGDEDNFRIQNQKLALVYESHLDKDVLNNFFLIKAPTIKNFKFFRVAHLDSICENENEKGTFLDATITVVLIDFGKAFDSRNADIFKFNTNIHKITIINPIYENKILPPFIFKLATPFQFKMAKKILSLDMANSDLILVNLMAEIDKNCNSFPDVLEKYCDNFKDSLGAKTFWEGVLEKRRRDAPREVIPLKPIKFYTWQLEMEAFCNTNPNQRDANWIVDVVGNSGKSEFIRQMCVNDPLKYKFLTHLKEKDVATTILEWLKPSKSDKNPWSGNVIFINLVRSHEGRDIYHALEELIDGQITSQKYMGESTTTKPMHIIVFSNFFPDKYTKKGHKTLSLDRWKIREISKNTKDGEIDYVSRELLEEEYEIAVDKQDVAEKLELLKSKRREKLNEQLALEKYYEEFPEEKPSYSPKKKTKSMKKTPIKDEEKEEKIF